MFPIEPPSREERDKDEKALKKLNAKELLKEGAWETRYEYPFEKTDLYIDFCDVGLKSTNYYHHAARMCCDSINSPSPVRSWFNPKFKSGLDKCKIAEGNMKVALALRKYIPSQFRPSAAKCLYETFDAVDVFDPCMGWGDRLGGFLASGALSYTGLDVNPHLFLGYQQQVNESMWDKEVDYIFERAEVFNTDKKFDFIFTSPPYYDIERYEGMWQSHAKYKKLDDWLKKFLFKMTENCFEMLEEGGNMLINISDVYGHHRINKLCEPMVNNLIDKGAVYEGCIGYRIKKRPNSKAKGKIFTR